MKIRRLNIFAFIEMGLILTLVCCGVRTETHEEPFSVNPIFTYNDAMFMRGAGQAGKAQMEALFPKGFQVEARVLKTDQAGVYEVRFTWTQQADSHWIIEASEVSADGSQVLSSSEPEWAYRTSEGIGITYENSVRQGRHYKYVMTMNVIRFGTFDADVAVVKTIFVNLEGVQ